MPKMDITISRSVKINTGNYSSADANVYLTLKDVEVSEATDKYAVLSGIVTKMMKIEAIKACHQQKIIEKKGLGEYLANAKEVLEELGVEIKTEMRKLE